MLFLAEMPAVIAEENNDGVLAIGRFLQRVEHPPNLPIQKRDAGEVRLYHFLPPAALDHFRVQFAVSRHFQSSSRHVSQVVALRWWQLNRLQRKAIEIFPGHGEGHVRLHESKGQEEGLFVFAVELLDPVAGYAVIRHVRIVIGQWIKLDDSDATILHTRIGLEARAVSTASKVIGPLACPMCAAVKNLSCAEHLIATLQKLRR